VNNNTINISGPTVASSRAIARHTVNRDRLIGTQDGYKLKAAEHVNVNKSAFKLAIHTGEASRMNRGDQWPRRVTVRPWCHGVSSSVGLNVEASSVHSSYLNEVIIHVLLNDVQETDVTGYGSSATAYQRLPTSGDIAGEHISLSQTNSSTRTDGGPSFTNNTLCFYVEDGIRNTRNGIDTVVNEGSSEGDSVVIHSTATARSENSPTVVIQISGNREDVDHT